MTRILLALGALIIFGTVNWQIAAKERLRNNGQSVFLELAPVDPRSLMQGDYMALNFVLVREISGSASGRVVLPVRGSGAAILRLDEQRVGRFSRMDDGTALAPGEMRFRFRLRSEEVWLGTNAFFFHEGEEERYRGARFGEFRVNDDGAAMLVDLRDIELRKMLGGPKTNSE